ncbi:MAG: radical SAM protein [Candidatus Parcubacteria bacterium]|nr:radical SAM protein [Candidatus Parcubacteria bacterium]
MDLDKLKEILDKLEEPAYRFKQIKLAAYRDLKEGFDFIDNIPQGLKESLSRLIPWSELTLKTEQRSLDGTIKKLFVTSDGLAIESVLIKHEDLRRTVCVSTEAGCQINCSFCATGHLGFKRVLTSSEIFEQVLSFARELKGKNEKVTNIVFMGMGEPFLNYANVKEAILLLNDKEGFNLGQRHISVSTSGIIPGIKSFTEENWQINLAISLHASNNELRSKTGRLTWPFLCTPLIMNCAQNLCRLTKSIPWRN